ncbi:MAG: hypothetical protein DRJ41_02595, partial [Thermoprotei archaeon]
KLFGRYVYSELKICEVEGWFLGMEYPTIIMMTSKAYLSNTSILEMVIAHEVAHQWWYAMIGNDQASEPFLDESLASYSQALYLEHTYGYDRFISEVRRMQTTYFAHLRTRDSDYALSSSVWDFNSTNEYLLTFYYKGPLLLHYLRWSLGDEKFFLILKEMYKRFLFSEVSIEKLLEIIREIAGSNFSDIFERYFESKNIPYVNITVNCKIIDNNKYKILIYNNSSLNNLIIPIKIRENEKSEFFKLEKYIVYITNNLPIEIKIDPHYVILGKLNKRIIIINVNECNN